MPDYILDIPDEVLVNAAIEERKRVLIRMPTDYAGELDIHIRTPASGRVYEPAGLSVEVADGFESIMEAMDAIGMRGRQGLINLEKSYERAGMPSVTQARTYLLIGWDDLKPLAPSPSGERPRQYIELSPKLFGQLFTDHAPLIGHMVAGTFNYAAGPLLITESESAASRRLSGWEIQTDVIPNGVWHGPLRKLPAGYALAAGFNNEREAAEMFRTHSFIRGRTVDYDTPVTALYFNAADAKNITFRPANDSILRINAAPKSGRALRKLSL